MGIRKPSSDQVLLSLSVKMASSFGVLDYWSVGKRQNRKSNLNRFFHYSTTPLLQHRAIREKDHLDSLWRAQGQDSNSLLPHFTINLNHKCGPSNPVTMLSFKFFQVAAFEGKMNNQVKTPSRTFEEPSIEDDW